MNKDHLRYRLNFYTCRANDENSLEIHFGAIDFSTPRTTLPSSIGNGVNFITKFMSTRLSGNNTESAKPLVDYLLALNHHGEVHIYKLDVLLNQLVDSIIKRR